MEALVDLLPFVRSLSGRAIEEADAVTMPETAVVVATVVLVSDETDVLTLAAAASRQAQKSPPVHSPHLSSSSVLRSWLGEEMSGLTSSSTARQRHSSLEWHKPHAAA